MLVHNAPAGQSPGRRALEPEQGGGWCVWPRDNAVRRFDAVVVAVGHGWCPKLPVYPGVFAGHTSHSHHYRAAESFAGGRMLVVGGGSSAADRQIVPAVAPAALFVAGCVDAPRTPLSLVETRGDWIDAVLGGRLVLPRPGRCGVRSPVPNAAPANASPTRHP